VTLNINSPVSIVPLIGPRYERILAKLDIFTVKDLLYHFPSRYEDYSKIVKTKSARVGEVVTVIGEIKEARNILTKNRKRITKVLLSDETGEIQAIWFNQYFLSGVFKNIPKLSLSGEVSFFDRDKALISPEYEIVRAQKLIHTGRLVPIYPETRGVSSKWLRGRINYVLNSVSLNDQFPQNLLKSQNLIPLENALNQIHFPKSLEEVKLAKERFAFEEVFELILKAEVKKLNRESLRSKKAFKLFEEEVGKLIESLPFKLTFSQENAVSEIISDLTKEKPMNRLLQGDVGSGKTVVALIASFLSYLNGSKVIYMAPTEILAKQHFETFKEYLDPFKIKVSLTTSSKKGDLSADINIGTHALLFNKKEAVNAGLIIIDEQHRFGVLQRGQLTKSEDGSAPHVLTMTATPIPRTLALTIYGDLDISTLSELPEGRIKVTTWVVPKEKREGAYTWLKTKILNASSTQKAFIVCPLIEESDKESMENVKAAASEFKNLSNGILEGVKTGLIHGKMKAKEKEGVIENFSKGDLKVLIATPVIEVGLDITDATIIIIEAAERFGLASLHQIRGRVGRSDKKSYCLLFTESQNDSVLKRLKALETTHNGLKLSEIDLKARGQGDVFGVRQHGIVNFKVFNPSDFNLIKRTKSAVLNILNNPKENSNLIDQILKQGRISQT